MTSPIPTTFEVESGDLGLVRIAAWVFPPQHGEAGSPPLWAVCFPGATYRGLAYYDTQVDGCSPDTYSMARHLATQGMGLVVIDNLGTGESRVPVSGWKLDRRLLADVYRDLIAQVRDRLVCGMLLPGLAPIDDHTLFLGGIGHSMGGMLLSHLQAHHAPFDAICLLGWATLTMLTHLPGTSPVLFEQVAEAITSDGYIPTSLRQAIRPWFFSPAIPEEIIAADEADATIAPAAWLAEMQPRALIQEAARITCPLFLGFGGIDVTSTPSEEVAAYPQARSIMLFVQAEAHHCANVEPGRFALWLAITDFLHAQAAQMSLSRLLTEQEDAARTMPLVL